MPRDGGKRARAAAGGIGDHDLAQPAVGPAHPRQFCTVARERGPQFERVGLTRQPPRLGPGAVFRPQFAQAFEHDLAACRSHGREFDHLGGETVGRNRDLRMRRVGDGAGIVDLERDFRGFAPGGGDAAQLAARPIDQRAAVGGPGHRRISAVHRPGFLEIEVEPAGQPPLDARRQVLEPQFGLVLVAADEGDPFAVGRGLRPHRAAVSRDRGGDLPGFQIDALDGEIALRGILRIDEGAAGRGVAGVIDRGAIWRVDRLAELFLQFLGGARDQLYPAAARDVVDPDLAGAERALGGEMLLGDDVFAVGAPARLVEKAEILLRHLTLVVAIDVHDPNVVPPSPIRGEGDAAAVGRKARLHFPRQPLGDAARRAAGDGHGVDVAEQGEDQRAAVGRDVEVHPGALGGADRHLAQRGVKRGVDVPLGILLGRGDGGERAGHGGLAGAFAGLVLGRCIHLLLLDRIGRGWLRALRESGPPTDLAREQRGDHGGGRSKVRRFHGIVPCVRRSLAGGTAWQ